MSHPDAEERRRGRGRPPKPAADKRRNPITVRYTDEELDRLERLAAEAGEAVASYVWRQTRDER